MLVLAPDDLRGLTPRALDDVLTRSDLTVAFGDGDLRGLAAAAFLFADYTVMKRGASLSVDTPEAWAGAVWRLGRGALRWLAGGVNVDEVVDEWTDDEPGQWLEEWIRHRSVIALDAAAGLIRFRGGDRLERAEFARLFAIGEPQKGLSAFLAKVRPSYSDDPETDHEPQ